MRRRDQFNRPIGFRAAVERPMRRAAQIDRRGTLPAFLAAQAGQQIGKPRITPLAQDHLDRRHRDATGAPFAVDMQPAIRPIGQAMV